MAETPNHNPLALILSEGVRITKSLLPDWTPPDLDHPGQRVYEDQFALFEDIVPGDQIMVQDAPGYWHHAVFVGPQTVGGRQVKAVVDAWGVDKEQSTISIRPLSAFTVGGVRFAKAKYDAALALPLSLSVALALSLVKWADENKFVYNAWTCNCDHVATFCCTGRCGTVLMDHEALGVQLRRIIARPPSRPLVRGFKGGWGTRPLDRDRMIE